MTWTKLENRLKQLFSEGILTLDGTMVEAPVVKPST